MRIMLPSFPAIGFVVSMTILPANDPLGDRFSHNQNSVQNTTSPKLAAAAGVPLRAFDLSVEPVILTVQDDAKN